MPRLPSLWHDGSAVNQTVGPTILIDQRKVAATVKPTSRAGAV
jgi:hypothetical protein